MKNKKNYLIFLNFLILPILTIGAFFYLSASAKTKTDSFRPGEIIVKFKNDRNLYKIKVSLDLDIFSVINQYQNGLGVESIKPNYLVKMTAFPNDVDYSLQWYLNPIKAKDAWSKVLVTREQEFISKKSVIAILDSGVDLGHPDLNSQIWRNTKEIPNDGVDNDNNGYVDDINGWDFIENDNNPNPTFSFGFDESAVKHGTIVASIAAAASHNQQGIAGVSWFSQIMPLRVLDGNGAGDVYTVIQAINYAVANGAEVINMSFIGSHFDQDWLNAIRNAYQKNVLVVAAAGNTDPTVNGFNLDQNKFYPICFNGEAGENLVIGVASVGKDLKKSGFSNYGSCIDIAAPGESFYAAQPYNPKIGGFDKYYDGYWSGTSLAAPLVSGTIGLIKSIRPSLSADQIISFIKEGAANIDQYNPDFRQKLGAGLLDAGSVVEVTLGKRVAKEKGGQDNYLVAGLGAGSFPQIRIFKTDGTIFKEFYAFSPQFNGLINVSTGDINGDGQDEVIAAAGFGGGPHIRIFNVEGQLISQFFAFDKKLRGGVNVAVGDINGDGSDEIIAAAGRGSPPEIKIFDYQGNLLNAILAYHPSFTGGVKVAAADFNHDGKADIVSGAGAGGGPHVRVFKENGELISQFFAFNKNFRGGINLAAGDIHGDGQPEILVAVEKNSTPQVSAFTYLGTPLESFLSYEPNNLFGVNLAAGDINNDGISEIITGPGVGGPPQIRVFNRQGQKSFEISAYRSGYLAGVRVSVLRY